MSTKMNYLKKLLQRKNGVTSIEICHIMGTVCPHRRLTDLKEQGWEITKMPVEGKNYNRYFGKAPKVQA